MRQGPIGGPLQAESTTVQLLTLTAEALDAAVTAHKVVVNGRQQDYVPKGCSVGWHLVCCCSCLFS
jgi:hypothetical protein